VGQAGRADVRDDVVVEVAAVGVEGRRPHGGLDRGQPLEQVLGDGVAGR